MSTNRKWTDTDLQRVMSQDSLADAERITGDSYKESPDTAMLGMVLQMRNGEARRRMLADSDDVRYGLTIEQYEACIGRMGFERVLLLPFVDSEHGERQENSFRVYWNNRIGSMMHLDTYYGNKSVNGGKWHYAWKPNEGENRFNCTSSGSFTEGGIWLGDHDCREGVGIAIRMFEQCGAFVKPWPKYYRLPWLAHYMDWKHSKDWQVNSAHVDRVSAERWLMLPEEIRKACRWEEYQAAANQGA